jgi:hypothetical protein
MGCCKLGLAVIAAMCLFARFAPEPAQAAPPLALGDVTPAAVIHVAQEGPRFHGRRAQSVYCLPRNYWWFYRPYTTAPENYPRCEPYFHYLDPPYGRRGARSESYFK